MRASWTISSANSSITLTRPFFTPRSMKVYRRKPGWIHASAVVIGAERKITVPSWVTSGTVLTFGCMSQVIGKGFDAPFSPGFAMCCSAVGQSETISICLLEIRYEKDSTNLRLSGIGTGLPRPRRPAVFAMSFMISFFTESRMISAAFLSMVGGIWTALGASRLSRGFP